MTDKNTFWNSAAVAGLVLGGVSIAYMLITWLLSKIPSNHSVLISLVSIVLWGVKLWGCIALMKLFTRKYAAADKTVTNSDSFRFGTTVAAASAIIYAGFYLAYVSYIDPDIFNSALAALEDNPMMTQESWDSIDNLMPKLPTITFFVNLFYCWLFGSVVAAIISKNIPSDNPFEEDDKTDGQ